MVATVQIPGSKSITNRALFLAAAAAGRSTLQHPLRSDDSEAFSEGLATLGYPVDTTSDAEWSIEGSATGPQAGSAEIFCRDAATASRFLPALASAGQGRFRFDATEQMRRRPVGPVVAALQSLGVEVRHLGTEGHLPIELTTTGVDGGDVVVDAALSSQFLSAILMLGPLTRQGLKVQVQGELVSQPYVEITTAMMADFGVEVGIDGTTYTVPATPYQARVLAVEPDASTASYFFAAAALTGGEVTVPRLGSRSHQGDLGFVRVLEQMGAEVNQTVDTTTVSGTGGLSGLTVNMRDISDTMPTLAAIAPFADGPVRIVDVYNTRVKECDRLAACADNLTSLGITVETGRDWIEIQPGTPTGGTIACHGDHRIAMAFSITGLRAEGINLDDPGCVRKTFPGFHEALAELRSSLLV